MKYLILALLFIAGCGGDPGPMPQAQEQKEKGPQSASGYYDADSVHHFEYKKHKYIQFGDGRCQSIVHDPDCPCWAKRLPALALSAPEKK